jgi:hypothetical protein
MWRMVIVLVMVVLCVHTAAALPGSGTPQDPWRIESLSDFDEFAADPNYWYGFTRLETDVNLAGRTYFTAVIAPDTNNAPRSGFNGTSFTGVFDGNDHKVIKLTINDAGAGNWYLGLFGYINGGEVKNLGLEGGSVSGFYFVGGLVGINLGIISNCYSTADVNGVGTVGGLVGGNDGSISNCYSTGSVSGDRYVGGLVGNNGEGYVSNCYSTGDVNGVDDVGGLVGKNGVWGYVPHIPGHIINSYSTGNVSGTGWSVGGLVGHNYMTVSYCYSTGDVSGDWSVGGLVGINGEGPAGPGLHYPGFIIDSYSTGSVHGDSAVGGLLGDNRCGDIERSFWDVETSGEPNMCGCQYEYSTGCDPNCGKTTAQMQTKSTFTDAGWDFVEIWGIGENQTYPFLRTEPAGDLNYDKKVDFFDLAILASHWLEERN